MIHYSDDQKGDSAKTNLVIVSHGQSVRKDVSQDIRADRPVISAGNEERVLLPDRGRVAEEPEVLRVPSPMRRMFENSFADPSVAAEMEEV